ncbi:MAG: hypothetical protein Q9228_006941 [Teloschistes exilis]
MWQPYRYPLSARSFVAQLAASEDIGIQVRLHHIESAIRSLYRAHSFESDDLPWVTTMPELRKLDASETKFRPLQPIMKDESTMSNNIYILEDIYLHQFRFSQDDSYFESALRLIYGDLKTWSRIRSVKETRSDISQSSFDKFDWILPGLGLWHLRFNMLQLIHKIHWSDHNQTDFSTLQHAADRWGRQRVVQPNDFKALEDLVIHSYQSRIVGVWIRYLKSQKFDTSNIEHTVPWLRSQSESSWIMALNNISQTLLPPPHTSVANERPPSVDQEFENHQNFCAHVEQYLTLRYAIKFADIGLLRLCLRTITLMFQSSHAGTPKYSQALLYLVHTTDTVAAHPQLQDAILANSLVNTRGATDSNYETDRLLEILNNNLKVFQQERSYFSRDSDTNLQKWALNLPYLFQLQHIIEGTFGRYNSLRHPEKSAAEDIWSMAYSLSNRSLVQSSRDRFSFNPTVNLIDHGLEALGANLLKYNDRYITIFQIEDEGTDPHTAAQSLENQTPDLETYDRPADLALLVEDSSTMFVE